MPHRRFSWLYKAPLLVVGMGFFALSSGGCGGEEEAACPAGTVKRDGKCYTQCDEQKTCGGSPNLKCVASPQTPDGTCFGTCTQNGDCKAGELCTSATTLKNEQAQVCAPRALLGLPPGKLNDACAQASECDLAGGLECLEGKCRKAPGRACDGDECSGGYTCFQGSCQTASGAPGEACGEGRGCVDGFVCLDGACQTAIAGPGENCSASRPCDQAQGLVCGGAVCRYGCNSFEGCAPGFECRQIEGGAFQGACVKSTFETGPGQYGTFCPKPEVCDQAAGFRCVGTPGDASAYCSKADGCTADADCPSGYWCGALRQAKDNKGNIDYANPVRVCMQRDFCAPCATDLDCSNVTGAICVPDADGEKFCSLPCSPDKNSCIIGAECVDTGSGVFACRPDVGYCHAKGKPTGCDPCRIDSDCGENALCDSGAIGNKSGMRWCRVPCGPKDENGKRSCPVAPNGAEMVCLDENLISLGGPFSSEDPNSVYAMCFRPFTVENTGASDEDPPNNACGNGKREGDEECDDGNPFSSDGCAKCKITDECRFTVTTDANGSVLKRGETVLKDIPFDCSSFLVEGTIKNAGGVGEFRFDMADGQYSWFEVFTGKVGACDKDLLAAVHTGDYDADTDVLDITDKNGNITACEKLSSTIKNLDAATPSLCPDNKLGCGSCTDKGLCGSCDDDSGIGNCPRLLLSTTLSVQGFAVKFASTKQMARISSRDAKATNVSFTAVVDRLTPGSQGPKNPPTLSCY
ncbi:MAG: hypothetical protein MUF64_09935 [Polyangiaceae bacterium]|jgi:hypothetical protein|nr:hypothetical protein [Polyangiaceae bacterium]